MITIYNSAKQQQGGHPLTVGSRVQILHINQGLEDSLNIWILEILRISRMMVWTPLIRNLSSVLYSI